MKRIRVTKELTGAWEIWESRKTWGSLAVEHECAIAETIAELYPDGIPDDPDLTAIEVAATRRLES